MTAKAFLLQGQTLQADIFNLETQIFELRTLAEKCTTFLSSGTGGGHEDRRLENLIVQIASMEEEQHRMELRLQKIQEAITEVLLQMRTPLSMCLLSERFVEFKTVELIAKDRKYSLRYVYKLFSSAIAEFTQLYDTLYPEGEKVDSMRTS